MGIGQGGVLQMRLRVAPGSVASGYTGARLPMCTYKGHHTMAMLIMAKKTVSVVWDICSRDSVVA